MRLAANLLGQRRGVSQLHLGGGTPTFLDLQQLSQLWSLFREQFTPLADAELAIEVNPVFTTVEQIALLREFGFNRISMGVQDFDPAVQHAIRREQTFVQTSNLVGAARKLGFRGINLGRDLAASAGDPSGSAGRLFIRLLAQSSTPSAQATGGAPGGNFEAEALSLCLQHPAGGGLSADWTGPFRPSR